MLKKSIRKLYPAFTLLEMLIVISILSITLLNGVILQKEGRNILLLNKEEQRLYLFLRQVQETSEQSNYVWYLIAHSDLTTKRWCLTAQLKDDLICDCFISNRCPKRLQAKFYFSEPSLSITFYTKNYYPKIMMRLSGIRNTLSSACIVLQLGELRRVFSFFNVGSIKRKDDRSHSLCVKG